MLLFAVFPLFWMVITTFKQDNDLYSWTNFPLWFNAPPTLVHLDRLLTETIFVRWLLNTGLLALLVVLITLLIALPAGYSLARLRFPAANTLGIGIFSAYLIPPTLLFIPMAKIIAALGLLDSFWALVVIYPTFTIPFSTWLFMGFFRAVPIELEEAALVDGCTRLNALRRVVLPLVIPGILTITIFTIDMVLQEFIYALTLVSGASQKTLTLGVTTHLVLGDIFFWGSLMAAALIAAIPVVIVYNLFLEQFVSGIIAGAER